MFLLCAFAMLALGWMLLLPGLFTSVIEARTGFPARVDYFYANPFTAEVRMRGLVLVNPAGFAEPDFLELHQFTAKADLFTLLGRNPVLDMTTIDLARITVVTNAQGSNNLDLMYHRLAPPMPKTTKPGTAAATSAPLQFLVRNLDVHINQVVVKDERRGKTSEQVHELSFNRTYHDVTPETNFAEGLPPAVTATAKSIGEVVSTDFKRFVANMTQPIDRKTYAWGEKRENSDGVTRKLEEPQKP